MIMSVKRWFIYCLKFAAVLLSVVGSREIWKQLVHMNITEESVQDEAMHLLNVQTAYDLFAEDILRGNLGDGCS